MRVTSVELHPAGSSDIAVMSFRDPGRKNPYNVKVINGLDADEIIPRYYGASGETKFYNLSLEKRELVIWVELNPDFKTGQSISDLRDAIYKMISSSRTGLLQIQFKDGLETIAAISGFVSKFEAPHFNKAPELQITITCNDPMLRALTPTIVDVVGLDPATTMIEDTKSTAPHGMKFEMSFTAAAASFSIGDVGWDFEVTPVGGFLIGDVLHFSSEYNDKHVYIVRGVDTIHLADVITPGSIWPLLFPGENTFVCGSPTSLNWDAISYYPTYWGV